jgi:CDP-diacylglycerol---serine O-phosphatidyltransferase
VPAAWDGAPWLEEKRCRTPELGHLYAPANLGQSGAKDRPVQPRRRKIDLKKTMFLLPNMITLSSIFCGFYSISVSAEATSDDDFYKASLLLIFALFFDMLDGRVARLTKTQSAFGLQIDSLADVVSFGVAPGILVYKYSLHQLGMAGLFISFMFAGAGAVRLARFNVLSMGEGGKPTKPGKYILGLPVPGAAGILIALVVANHAIAGNLGSRRYLWPMTGLTIFLAFLMVSTIKFRSFKPEFVLIWLLGFYVLLGLVETIISLPRRRIEPEERTSLPP